MADSLDEAKAAFRAGVGAGLHRVQVNPQNRQTGAAIAAHDVIRSGRGGRVALTDAAPTYVQRTRFTNSPRAREMTKSVQRAAVERPVLLREGSRWRALRLLAKSADGHTEPYLFARGISKALLAGLLRDGLATWSKARAGIERPIDIVRVKITDAGRQALE